MFPCVFKERLLVLQMRKNLAALQPYVIAVLHKSKDTDNRDNVAICSHVCYFSQWKNLKGYFTLLFYNFNF